MLAASSLAVADPAPVPPRAEPRDHVSVRHGTAVHDPYHWLRERDDPAVLDHLKRENAYTEAMTRDQQPFAQALYREMLGRIQETDLEVPVRRGAWWYHSRTEQGRQYAIHGRRRAGPDGRYDADAPEQVLLDLNALADGRAHLGLGTMRVSDDAGWLLYTLDDTGYRQYRLYRKNLATGQVDGPLAERVTGVEWAADDATVYYTTEHPVTKRSDTLWRLAAGAAPQRVYEEADELFRLELDRSKDRRYLLLRAEATDTWETRLLDLTVPRAPLRVVLPRERGHKYEVEHRAGRLYLRTNRGAKDFRIVSAPVDDPRPANWQPFVPARAGVLVDRIELFRAHAVVSERRAGLPRFRIHDFATRHWRTLGFAESTYAAQAIETPDFDSRSFRHGYQSLVTPPSVFEVDLASGASTLLKRQPVLGGYDPARYVAERRWVTARDGVRVPVSIVYRKGRLRDGRSPLWLTAYGAYGHGLPAGFSSWRLSLLDRGFAFAIAHVRGGDDLGEAWHDAGMLMRKMTTFTDFIDCAEQLLRDGWSGRERLVIEGGSAGGLLMGAVTNLRPDLFRAVHAKVPFVDVMNTMLDPSLPLTIGEYREWGDPNQPAAYASMLAWSPYDNLAAKAYPAMLVTTSLNDSQVMYWEPAKYVARLRTLKTDDRPLLLKTRLEPAGHGGASGRYDALRDRAFELAWMLQQVGIDH